MTKSAKWYAAMRNKRGKTARNQWTKAKDEGVDLKICQSTVEKMRKSATGKRHSSETKQKLSRIAHENMLGGHTSKCRLWYNGMFLHSSYELKIAKSLDENGISYSRGMCFRYTDHSGKTRRYYPDFYLSQYDCYIDPKNSYLIQKDQDKIKRVMEQNNIKILVLDESMLEWNVVKNLLTCPSG